MASPFAVFRRNQRAMIAVLGVVTILLFVIGDPLSKIIGRARAGNNPLIVKTNYGNYTRSDLAAVDRQRKLVDIFLQKVVTVRVAKDFEGMPLPPDPQQAQMWANLQAQQRYRVYQMVHGQLMARVGPAGDAATVETLVLAKRAEEMGMVVSDRAVNDYLRSIAGKAFSQVRDILSTIKTGDHTTLSESYLFDGLRREMLASKYTEMFLSAIRGMSPAERLGYFEQLNLKADAQVLPVKVEQFLKDVPQPSDEQLEAFFELHQNQLPEPNSPEPGFKEPVKVAFEYFKANLDKFIEQASDQVTSEEMHEYYEEHKATEFVEQDKDSPEKKGEMEDPLGPDEPQKDAPATKTDDSSVEPKDSAPDAGDAGKNDADSDNKNGDKKDSDKSPESKAPEGEKPADQAGPKSSRVEPKRGLSPFRLTSAPQPAADTKKPDDAAARGDKPAAPDDKPAATEDKPAAGEASPAGEDADKPKAETPDADKADGEKADTEKKPSQLKYQPFEKVEDKIRTRIATEKAQKAINEVFEKLHAKMRAYSSALSTYRANKEDDPDLQEPEPPNFPALAAEFKIESSEYGLISAFQAQQTDIGKSSNQQVTFLGLAYLDPRVYKPDVTFDGENNRYLWWITKTTPESVPSFEEVRSKVSLAFKMIKARELALAQAEKYAKQATDAKKTLHEVFRDREDLEVSDTGEFTRMTVGNMAYDPESSVPRLSPVHAVEAAGGKFMDAVFGSSPGEVKVALNQPEDIVYVIQVQRFMPSRELLDKEFIVEPFAKYARVADEDQRRLYFTWISTLEKDAGVDWVEPPSTDTRAQEQEEE